jgi:hypothetical protein
MELIESELNNLQISSDNNINNEANSWSTIDRLAFEKILSYVQKGRIIPISLTCKHWYKLSLPRIYSKVNVRKLNYFKKDYSNIDSKFSFVKELVSSNIPKFTHDDIKLMALCKNLSYLSLDNLLGMNNFEFLEFLDSIPNLSDLSLFGFDNRNGLSTVEFLELINSVSDKFEKLQGLHLTKMDCFDIETNQLLLNSKILANLRAFSLNPVENFNLRQIEMLCTNFNNLQVLTLNLEYFFNANDLNELIYKCWLLPKLEELYIKFSTPNTEEYLFQAPQQNQIVISNFHFKKLKVFNLRYLTSVRSFISQFSVPELDFSLRFEMYPENLTHLILPKIDGKLLTEFSKHCPLLVEIIMECPLPPPCAGYEIFINLKRVSATSFEYASIVHHFTMRRLMPNVTNFNLKSTYTNNTQLNQISLIFPNLHTLAINGAIPNINELLADPNTDKANWKQIYIFRFEYNPSKLLQLLKLLSNRLDYITLIWSGYQSNGINSSRLIYNQFKNTKVFTGFKETEFSYIGVELIER